MEIATLTAFISPFLSFQLKLGEKAAEKSTEVAVGKFGEAAWSKAQAVWEKLSPLEQDEGLVKAIAQILQADAPDGHPRHPNCSNYDGESEPADWSGARSHDDDRFFGRNLLAPSRYCKGNANIGELLTLH